MGAFHDAAKCSKVRAMTVDIDKLRALIDVLTERDIAEFEHEDEVERIRIVRGARGVDVAHAAPAVHHPHVVAHAQPAVSAAPAAGGATAPAGAGAVDVTS